MNRIIAACGNDCAACPRYTAHPCEKTDEELRDTAILVPSMIGYIGDSKLATANSNAKLVHENAATLATKLETAGYPITDGTKCAENITALDSDLAIATPSDTNNGAAYVKAQMKKMMTGDYGVQFKSGFPEKSSYRKTTSDTYVGLYPTAATAKGADMITE